MARCPHALRSAVPDSFFPTKEGPSFCSLPTPVVPAREDLRAFEAGVQTDQSGTLRLLTSPSSRPTFVPDEIAEPIVESGPIASLETPTVLEVPRVPSPSLPPGYAALSPAESAPVEPELALPAPSPARGRAILARLLFVMLFGGVTALLGYAVRPELAAAATHLRAVVTSR
jgi:hypothetical protein